MKSENQAKLADLACSPECFVTTLALMAVSGLGVECLEWEPEIVVDAFEQEYGISHLPQRSCDKLQTGLMLIGTNAFTATIEGFLAATKVMNNRLFDQSEAPYCNISMCAWSIYEYMQLMGEMQDGKPTETFSDDIIVYLQQAGGLNGLSKFPAWMSFADKEQMPDLSGDVSLFEMYNARQQEYDNLLVARVNNKQQKLKEQLGILVATGVISKNTEKDQKTA